MMPTTPNIQFNAFFKITKKTTEKRIIVAPSFQILKNDPVLAKVPAATCFTYWWHLKWYNHNKSTNPSLTCIQGCWSKKGLSISMDTPKRVAKTAAGQVMMNHSLSLIKAYCLDKISRSNVGFACASA